MRGFLEGIKAMFSGWVIFFYLVLYTLGSGAYFYLISKDAVVSLIVGVISSFVLFYSFNILNERMVRKENEMRDINDYVTTLVFYMKTGKNVLHSLQEVQKTAGDTVKEDIQEVIDGILKEGELNLEGFKRHNFVALDIFHNNLEIKYQQGGKAQDIFQSTTKDINYEISKRDQLRKNKEYVVQQEYMTVGLVLGIPAIISIMTGELYEQFLSIGFLSLIPLMIYFFVLVMTIFFMRRKQVDIDVSL